MRCNFKVGDYFIVGVNGFTNVPVRIVKISTDGFRFQLEPGAEYYYHSWMNILPKEVFESPLFKLMSEDEE